MAKFLMQCTIHHRIPEELGGDNGDMVSNGAIQFDMCQGKRATDRVRGLKESFRSHSKPLRP